MSEALPLGRSPYLRMAATLLALIGLLDASYLALERYTGADIVCVVGNGCSVVAASPYAVLFGVLPVAYLGLAAYLALFVLGLLAINEARLGPLPAIMLLRCGSAIGVLFSAYLVYLQLFVIHAICFWCMVSALIQLLIASLLLWDWRNDLR